jgi:hypothetical protein
MSATRAREANCLGIIMRDAWQAEEDLRSAEHAWRAAHQARFERSLARRDSSLLYLLVDNGYGPPGADAPMSVSDRSTGARSHESDEEQVLYREVTAAQARHKATTEWYRRVVRRVQTRIEEDDILYPVLGTLATSTAIVFYPLIRWNMRSVLWEGEDPDAEDDPVQVFCATRLGHETPAP